MKICLVTNQFASPFSGVGTYARVLASGLAAAGIDTTVLCPADQVGKAPDVAFVPLQRGTGLRSHARWLTLSYAISKHLGRAPSYDVIHFLDAREALFYRGSGPAVVGTIHDYYFSSPLEFWRERAFYPDWVERLTYASLVRALEPKAYGKAHCLIMNSNATRQRITTAYRLAETKSRTVYIGLLFDTVPPSNAPRREAILFVGGNPYRKGLPRLIKAVTHLRKRWPSLELWVAGTPLPRSMRTAAAGLMAHNALRVHPVLPAKALGELYRTSRVFALPGLTEAFGLVFLEAMAYNCPVIGPADGGAKEIIIDGTTGFLVPTRRDDLLLLRLSQYLTDKTLCQDIATRARDRLSRFTPQRMINETLASYEAAVS